jgi:PAS domain S-box-containing protein
MYPSAMTAPRTPAEAFFLHATDAAQWLELFDHLPSIYLFVKDTHHRFMRVNRAMCDLHGCAHEHQMLGRTDDDFHPPALAVQYLAEDREVFSTGRPTAERPWLVPDADGTPQWYLSSKRPVRDTSGKLIGLVGVMRPYAGAEDLPGQSHRLTPALQHVLAHYADPLPMRDVASKAHLSLSQFQREFRRLFGIPPGEYLTRVRLLMARRLLERTQRPIATIAMETGFYDQSHFTRTFRSATGLSPREHRLRFTRGQR